jgi:hypothetical protein
MRQFALMNARNEILRGAGMEEPSRYRWRLMSLAALALLGLALTGCRTFPPGAERGPHGTMAYLVAIEASEPGVRIEANNQYVGTTPLTLKIFGDTDGTFHDFGAYEYVIQAFPTKTNQYVQTRVFRTGRMFSPEDMIPRQIYFDMNQQPPPMPIYTVPAYPPPAYYPPSYFYGPGYYGSSFYFGPRFHFGPGHYRGHYHRHGGGYYYRRR